MTNLKTRTTNLNKITRARRPLATARGIPRLALTALLTLAPLGLALGAVTVAPGTAWAASACSGTSPASQLGPMTAWVYFPPAYPGGSASVTFEYGTQQEGITLPAGVDYSSLDSSWSGIDNPAPLLWYNARYPGDLGCVEFGSGVTYTSQLVAKMESEKFAPSSVGGVNPANMTAPTQSTTTSTSPPTPTNSGGGTQTTKTTSVPTQSPPATVQTQTPTVPIAPVTVTTPPTGAISHELLVIQRDRQLIADGPPPVIPPQSPPHHGYGVEVLVGGVVLALIVAVVVFVRRRHPKGIDDLNSDMARKFGRRN